MYLYDVHCTMYYVGSPSREAARFGTEPINAIEQMILNPDYTREVQV